MVTIPQLFSVFPPGNVFSQGGLLEVFFINNNNNNNNKNGIYIYVYIYIYIYIFKQ